MKYCLCFLMIYVHVVPQESGLSLLMVAVRESRLSVLDRLLELGVNPSDKTKVGVSHRLESRLK